jgi:hypothetical protein
MASNAQHVARAAGRSRRTHRVTSAHGSIENASRPREARRQRPRARPRDANRVRSHARLVLDVELICSGVGHGVVSGKTVSLQRRRERMAYSERVPTQCIRVRTRWPSVVESANARVSGPRRVMACGSPNNSFLRIPTSMSSYTAHPAGHAWCGARAPSARGAVWFPVSHTSALEREWQGQLSSWITRAQGPPDTTFNLLSEPESPQPMARHRGGNRAPSAQASSEETPCIPRRTPSR